MRDPSQPSDGFYGYGSWKREFLLLTNGVKRLKIIATRPEKDYIDSNILVDDITVWPCTEYGRVIIIISI